METGTVWNNIVEICTTYALKIVAVIGVFVVGKIIIRLVMKYFLNGKIAVKKMDPSVRRYVRSGLKIVLNLLLVVICVSILGVPMASIIAVFASVGAAIALAVQGSLANVASGFVLLVTRPFNVDDWITVGDRTGIVTELGMFYTTVRTLENLDVIIPNSELTSSVIVNNTREKERQSNLTVKVAYGTDPEKVRKIILDYLESCENVVKDPAPFCEMSAMSDSSIDFTVRFRCEQKDYWNAYFAFQKDIYRLLNEEGVRIPYNQLDVHIVEEKE